MSIVACTRCRKPYPASENPFLCECGGIYDFIEFPEYSERLEGHIDVWGYRNSLDIQDDAAVVSLGEGGTPLLQVEINGYPMWLKMESQNPTGSYKDRGSTTLVSHLKARNVNYSVEDSSGNAGASFAAYCARGNIRCKIFVPESASGPKRTQIEMFGAELIRVPGPRSEAAKAVLSEAARGAVYGSHAYMPFGLPGIATIAYEIVEQLGEVPSIIIAPAGHGGLLYGIMRGFEAMQNSGTVKSQPYYVGVQAEACAPIVKGYVERSMEPKIINPGETLAEGVKVAMPTRGAAILQRISGGKGKMISITESQLIAAHKELAQMGIYCEPTSALVWAGAKNLDFSKEKTVVAIITGSGYKSSQNLTGIV
jgi:threonine synthase